MPSLKISLLSAALAVAILAACAPAAPSALPAGTLLPAASATPAPIPAASTTPAPGDAAAKTSYSSPRLGIQLSYPAAWHLQETPAGAEVTSFDPANPPHKLEWTDQTVKIQFGFAVLAAPAGSLDAWVESARQMALSTQLSVYAEERLAIANQPAAHLTLVSGSGGVIHQVLASLNGRDYEIYVEGNYDLAKAVLDSMLPLASGGLKPADSDTPAAGICGEAQGDPALIILGYGPDGLPLAGRCLTITPAQRIHLVNQSSQPISAPFADYQIDLPPGGEMLLDRPVGQYLELGVHFMPAGPELWVKKGPEGAAATGAPAASVAYENSVLGYRLNLPVDWRIDESGLTSSASREVIFSPAAAEPFVTWLSISLDTRTLDQITSLYAQSVPDAAREDTLFNGYPAVKYVYAQRHEYYVPAGGQIFLIATDQPDDSVIQLILMTLQFTAPAPTYEVTMADQGKTFSLKVGESLRLNLEAGYDWSASVDNPAVVEGLQGVYQARAAGVARLAVSGNPQCLSSSPPCLAPSLIFEITLIVQ